MKPLICIPSPRDIPEFFEATAFLPADKFWVKYQPEAKAYNAIRQYFLEHTEYTHLVLLPDDLLAAPEDFEKLVADIELNNLDILSGVCNVEFSSMHIFNICDHLPSLDLCNRTYTWKHEVEIVPGLMQVGFSGEALMFISRRIVRQLSFEGDERQSSFDLVMCHELKRLGVPVYVNTSVRMLHLKGRVSSTDAILVGKRPEESFLDRYGDVTVRLALRRHRLEKTWKLFASQTQGANSVTIELLREIVETILSRLPLLELS